MSSTYQYEELPAGKWIRLLRLLPGTSDDEIHVELFTTGLKNAPPYESISYCWGDPDDQEDIICLGQTMYITKSLSSGFKCFRYPEKARVLWVDAVCINQSDDKEKGLQVNMMGDVYDRATRVLVWLGEASNHDAEKAFRLLRAINEYIDSQIVESELAVDPWKAVVNVPMLVDRSLLFQDPSESAVLHNFWRLPWFGRVWVVQEVALASSAWVFYGASSISLSQVIQAAYLLSWRSDLQDNFLVGRWVDVFANTLATYTSKETWIQETRLLRHWQEYLARTDKPRFDRILLSSPRFEASNSLDHIYAFLGHPAAKSKDGNSSILDADYTISVEDACQRLAQKLYERDQRLDFLSTISHFTLSDIEDFPSWVPKVHKEKVDHTLDCEKWDADNSVETEFPKAIFQSSMLHGWAFISDSIVSHSETFGWGLFESVGPSPVEICWNLQADAIPSADKEKRLEALMVTLVGGLYKGRMVDLRRDFVSYCREKTSSQFCSNIRLEDIEKGDASMVDGNWKGFVSVASNKMSGRRFFITDCGRFGLGPSFLEDGDICGVLLGCRMPLVFRSMSTSGHFKVLGPSYVDGGMDGELIDAHVKSTSDLSEITLV
jgi:hypothetical protein